MLEMKAGKTRAAAAASSQDDDDDDAPIITLASPKSAQGTSQPVSASARAVGRFIFAFEGGGSETRARAQRSRHATYASGRVCAGRTSAAVHHPRDADRCLFCNIPAVARPKFCAFSCLFTCPTARCRTVAAAALPSVRDTETQMEDANVSASTRLAGMQACERTISERVVAHVQGGKRVGEEAQVEGEEDADLAGLDWDMLDALEKTATAQSEATQIATTSARSTCDSASAAAACSSAGDVDAVATPGKQPQSSSARVLKQLSFDHPGPASAAFFSVAAGACGAGAGSLGARSTRQSTDDSTPSRCVSTGVFVFVFMFVCVCVRARARTDV